jgi:hypothetical protein
VRADEKLRAFVELESAIGTVNLLAAETQLRLVAKKKTDGRRN